MLSRVFSKLPHAPNVLASRTYSTHAHTRTELIKRPRPLTIPDYPVKPPKQQIPSRFRPQPNYPKQEFRTFKDFCAAIGRDAAEHAEAFGDFQEFLKASSEELKQKGIDTRLRRYMLSMRHNHLQGKHVQEVKQSKKWHGGERNRRRFEAELEAKMRR
ncbi:hypothetical protein BABINDRAFT_159711 [Babjeviella inositovora NRRL Y-12698]|uniref:Small ribosomal subunit protein mS41 n=1 Tax=Babjeviella inositovora NRRL Y-12698 TaxID=984486 RepID=A0A1E3QUM7_9ASCO|nr:uncharacterized protein BABINDRAFT_159711 [Babjeviella inositovora NRRL Y-12698]ODQ81413.1 hypothetical protein BABINDRAFT_159711 [Babjeviella inositovora NRRL Y-12698]